MIATNLQQTLQEKFGTGNNIVFERSDSGMILVKIDNALATSTVSLYGGQILEWQPKSQTFPVLWCSDLVKFLPGKAIRAGVPICWPWFGAHPENNNNPSHGYARISPWQLHSLTNDLSGATEICMRMADADNTHADRDYAASLEINMLIGESLRIELKTTNCGRGSMTFTEALHAYFNIGDIGQVSVNGLNGFEYVDLVDKNLHKTQTGDIFFSAELGRVYLNTNSDCLIKDSARSRIIRITKSGSQSTVVWNPWLDTATKMDDLGASGWKSMLCVESANALQNTVMLKPGEQHTLSVNYSVENL